MQKTITKEEINELPLLEYHGKIVLIENDSDVKSAVEELRKSSVLGFDTETRPSFQKGEVYQVALLQLATLDTVFLFRLNRVKLSPELATLLADEKIIKTGVAIRDDIKGLQKLRPFEPKGFFDLSTMATTQGVTSIGLRALSALFLGERLSKAAKITNWERPTLSEQQIKYAATDAYVGLMIYLKMKEQGY